MDKYIVGIDVGSSKVYGSVGRVDRNGKLEIVAIASANCSGIKRAVVVDIENTADAVRNCILQLERMVDMKITHAYISLSGGICEFKKNKALVAVSSESREVNESDVKRVLDAVSNVSISSDKEIIGVVPEQYIIDGYDNVKDPLGMSGSRLEVEAKIIIAQTLVVNNLFKSFNKIGINLSGIILQPIAASQVVLSTEEMRTVTAIIDVGADTSDISVFKGNNLCFSDVINLGGNNITNDISICLKIPFQEAERIKTRFGSVRKISANADEIIKINAAYNEESEVKLSMLNEIINDRVEEIITYILKKLNKSGYYKEISGVIIIGGGLSLFDGVCDLAKEIIGKNARIGMPGYVGATSPIYTNCIGILQDVVRTLKVKDANEDFDDLTDEKPWNNIKKDGSSLVFKIRKFLGDFF